MIDLQKARIAFKEYINGFNNQDDPGFNLKVVHTYHVVENAMMISKKLGLSEEDINLAGLIGILHDIGRFDELKNFKKFDSVENDHALVASKLLFEDGLINKFIDTDKYNNIIKKAIENHNKKAIEDGLSEKELLHAKIIRDADKLDNYRVKKEEKIENIFPGIVKSADDLENSLISDKVYNSIVKEECVDIKDRVYPLDYWICILGFTFDINFKETLSIIKENDYINVLIDRFNYTYSKDKMNEIRNIINNYIENKLDEETELEDLYDNSFNKLNKTIRRRIDEIPEGCYVMMSYVLIKNDNKYLLEKATARSNNTLAIPGGHVLAGEDPLSALKRELKEELELENNNIKHIDTFIYPYNNYIFNIYLIEDDINISNLEYSKDEVLGIDWYAKEEILNNIKEGKVNKGYAYILEKYLN